MALSMVMGFNFLNHCVEKYTVYTLWISRCIAAARKRIPGSIDNYVIENDVTGVSECRQQRSNLKDDGYIKLNAQKCRGLLID